jgi:hypothetical protein
MLNALFQAPSWVFVLLNLMTVLIVAVSTYHYHYSTHPSLHWQLQPYSPLRALRAFALGFSEHRSEYTPYFSDDALSNAYDRGRSVASTVTFSKYEV